MNAEASRRSASLPSLTLLAESFALVRLPPSDAVPAWAASARAFLTISRTPTELSIVADEAAVPAQVSAKRAYRALRVDGPLSLELVGIFAALATPLAAAKVPIFPIATFDTDYVLLHESVLARAVEALEGAGCRVAGEHD